jgi:hypothetical protein
MAAGWLLRHSTAGRAADSSYCYATRLHSLLNSFYRLIATIIYQLTDELSYQRSILHWIMPAIFYSIMEKDIIISYK